MRNELPYLVFGCAAMLGAGTSMASVDHARTAVKIANRVCVHPGGLRPISGMSTADWHVRLDGDTWKVWTGVEGQDLVVLVPRHGPAPTKCQSRVSD